MGKLIEDPNLHNRVHVFPDRTAAGRRLASCLQGYQGKEPYLFAIPAGGVPVAAEIARVLEVPLDLVIVRKIQLPWTTEAGFGALNPAGEAIFNQGLLRRLGLSAAEIEAQREKTAAVVRQREVRLRGGRPYPLLHGKPAIIVDDGLASGYTMRAALQFLNGRGAGKLIVAVPTASEGTALDLLSEVDELYCLNLRGGYSFAVADAYEDWYDLTEEEVLEILSSIEKFLPGRDRDRDSLL